MEGFATLRALADNNSGVNVGFVKGGLVGSLQGRLANEKAKGRHVEYSQLSSVGRLFYEPVWVFTRGDLPITSLRDLKGKRILNGTRESGSRRIVNTLLRANGVDKDTATLLAEDLPADGGPLVNGAADAAIVVLAADNAKIQELLRVPGLRLMDFTQEADAYANRFPAITKVVLRQGAVEFDPLIPTDDITLLSTSVALVVRPDMHPALVILLTGAVVNNPKSGFDKNGDPVLFYPRRRVSQLPAIPSFEVTHDARVVYKTRRAALHAAPAGADDPSAWAAVPYTAFFSTHAAKLVLLIPLLAVIWPLTRALPMLYVWTMRRRLVYWYRQLKLLERRLDATGVRYDPGTLQADIERIDAAVRKIRVPHLLLQPAL